MKHGIKFKVYLFLGYIFCELAFRMNCWGPFSYCYRAGNWFNNKLHYEMLKLNPVDSLWVNVLRHESELKGLTSVQAQELLRERGFPESVIDAYLLDK